MNQRIQDPIRNKMILINECTLEAIASFPDMKAIYDVEHACYIPDASTVAQLKPLVNDIKISVILGTWCGDSQLQFPRFTKLLDMLEIEERVITLICTDGNKNTEGGLTDRLDITNVPTFIIYGDQKELGRIIETPVVSLEEDLLFILEKK